MFPWPFRGKIIFLEFLGSDMKIEVEQNMVSIEGKGRTFETLLAVSKGFDQNYLAKLSTQSSLELIISL